MFANMKGGRGLPKELLKRLEEKKAEIVPEVLVVGEAPEEIQTTRAATRNSEGVVEVDVQEDDMEQEESFRSNNFTSIFN